MKKNVYGVALPAFLAFCFTVPLSDANASTFIVDDFNSTNTYTETDTTAGDGGSGPTNFPIDAGNTVMNVLGGAPGWTRDLDADLAVGDQLSAQVCAACQAGHHISGAAGSTGTSSWIYAGPSIAVKLGSLYFDYAADLDGGDIVFTFGNDNAGLEVSVTEAGLPNTNNSSDIAVNGQRIFVDLPDSQDWQDVFADITDVRIDVLGVADLDLTFDNVTLVPVPTTIALLGAGLVALGFTKRRQA